MKKKLVTIGIPCFNEQDNVVYAFTQVSKVLKKHRQYQFCFLYTDNGSTDKTREKILSLIKRNANVKGVFLSRNFGFEASIAALIDHAEGDALVVLPCDLQDPPELIPQFLKKWEQGNQIVAGKYKNTEDDIITAFLRKSFYFIFKKISDLDIPVNASEVALLDKKAYIALRLLHERFRFFRGLRVWVGFKVAFIHYHRSKRLYGSSAYNLLSYFKYAERGIYGFSYLLLDLMMYLSMLFVGISSVSVLAYVVIHLWMKQPFGVLQTILLALFFLGTVILFGMGILGKYIQVLVEEAKNRPVYVVDELVGRKHA
jgi:glycosyltransferase involved in cell wall biosynthesis